MQIVDAQIHLWGSGLPSNLSHRQVTAFTPEEAILLMDEGGVDAAVIHPPGWDPGSTDMAFAAVRNYPGRFAIMGALRHDRLAVDGSRGCRRPDRHARDGFAVGARTNSRAPPRASPDDRPPGRQRRHIDTKRRRRDDPYAGAFGAGEAPQCGGQGDRRTALFQRALSVSGAAHLSAASL